MSKSDESNVPQNYRTLLLSGNQLELVNEKITIPEEPWLIVRPKLVGICRSDIKEFLGTRTIRHDFGHEIFGEVMASSSPQLPQLGSLVVLDPHIEIKRSSGFGELIVASADIDSLRKAFVIISSSILEDKLVFVEPLSCAHHCVANLLKFKKQERLEGLSIGIVGAGMTAILIGLLYKYYGAAITLINRSKGRIDFLKSTSIFSEKELCLSNEIDQEFDVVIPTTTFLVPEVLEFCEKIVKNKGSILLYGGTTAGDLFPGQDVDIDDIRRNQKMETVASTKSFKLCGTHGATTEDFIAILTILKDYSESLPVERLISQRIDLEEVPSTIFAMTKEESFGKTIMVNRLNGLQKEA